MIWIIGGTSEASELVDRIKGRVDYIVTVATYCGKEVLGEGNIVVSRFTKDQMAEFIKENNISTVVDMSHPYAVEVTRNAGEAAKEAGIKYIRYVREKSDTEGSVYFKDIKSCIDYLRSIKGCVFFTTGIKNICDFEKIKGENRFIYRVLPTTFSMEECVKNNVRMDDIVAILGPVSDALNEAMFKEFKADYVVMKDSGIRGGTPEKISACKRAGIIPLIIGREDEDGIYSMDKLLEMIL